MDEVKVDASQYAGLIEDLKHPNPLIYWCDFLGSISVLYLCFLVRAFHAFSGLLTPIMFLTGLFFMYRCGVFMHEIVHRGPSQLPGFSGTYNLLFGYLFKLPVFLYTPHLQHHIP